MTRSSHLLLCLLLLLSAPIFAQKVKVKKGIICLNGVEMYRIVETGWHEKAILAIEDGDTLVWMRQRQIIGTKADFETEERVLNYWELSFASPGLECHYIIQKKDDLYKDLIWYRALSNQAVDEEGFKLFEHQAHPRGLAVSLFQQAIEKRNELQSRKDYASYSKPNAKRNANAELSISNKIVLYKPLDGSVPAALGRIEFFRDGDKTGYKVYRNTDQQEIAVIEENPNPLSMKIKTSFDHGTVSFVPTGGDDYNDYLHLALRFLADAGYF